MTPEKLIVAVLLLPITLPLAVLVVGAMILADIQDWWEADDGEA